ncbi:hypothetical protein O181_079415 [Austropuccinia psidii MF-1]|uniref:Uncharacterized protein n=1 Tax=Austropuccinia psidii MF-1 TaxID=1389203 RepID=A0A9Q3FET7_9BASI|nr:hypothetical protein [Austropuccinia psidii MF-1]
MIQNLEEMMRRFCAYGLEFKESDGFTIDWCTMIPALVLAYSTSVHPSTGKTPAIIEKGWNPRLPGDTLRKDLIDIDPTASSFKIILDKVKNHSKKVQMMLFTMQNRSGTRVISTRLQSRELALVSTLNFYDIKGQKQLKDSYVGTFLFVGLNRINVVQMKLSG